MQWCGRQWFENTGTSTQSKQQQQQQQQQHHHHHHHHQQHRCARHSLQVLRHYPLSLARFECARREHTLGPAGRVRRRQLGANVARAFLVRHGTGCAECMMMRRRCGGLYGGGAFALGRRCVHCDVEVCARGGGGGCARDAFVWRVRRGFKCMMRVAEARAARLSLMLRLLLAACCCLLLLLLLLLAADAAAWLLLPLPLHAAEAAAAAIIELVLWAVGWQENGSSPSFMQPKFSSKP